MLEATLEIPTAGSLVAVGSAEAFCYNSGVPEALCGGSTPASDGCLRMSLSGSAPACDGAGYSYFWLPREESNTVTRATTFEVEAGTHTVYLRGGNNGSGIQGELGFFHRDLTVMFIPE